MRQQGSPDFSLESILRSEGTQGFLGRLSDLGRLSLTVYDERARPLAVIPAGEAQPSRPGAPSPTDSPLVQEIRFQDRCVGEVHGAGANGADSETARGMLKLAADWIVEKIENEYSQNSLAAEILNNYEELNLLYEVSQEISSVFDVHEICEIVLRKALTIIGAEKASIFLWNENDRRLHMMASVGLPEQISDSLTLDPDTGVCGYVYRTGKALLVEDLASLPRDLSPGEGTYRTESFLSMPLLASPMKVKGKVIGVINLADSPSASSYHAADLKLLSAISSQATLSVYNSTLIRDLKENERIQREMEIAETVQKNLLPRKAPRIPGVDLAGRCVPAKKVGGDYYDFFPSPQGGVGFLVADVSGHSISSGIMMAITRGLLQSEAVHEKSPGKLLADINRTLFPDLVSSELFITMAYFHYDPVRRLLSFADAGHNPPALLRAGSTQAELLDAEGMAIGFLPEVEFEEKQFSLCPGDLVVLYTDGLVEAENPQGEQFGIKRFLRRLDQTRHGTAAEILESLFGAAMEHIGGTDPHALQRDDLTLVVLKIQGDPPARG